MFPGNFIILPLGGILISCLLLAIFWYYLKQHTMPLLLSLEDEFHKLLQESSLDREITSLIDTRLNDVISAFKVQIPMAGMFLGKAREDSLKEIAKKELLKVIPSVKEKLKEKVLIGDQVRRIIDTYLSSARRQLLCLAILSGAAVGLLEAIILMYYPAS